jgi:hypothetical protein
MPNYGDYWFAMKAQDDAGLNSSISSSVVGFSPYYLLDPTSIRCINTISNDFCNKTYTLSGNTNYLYSTINVSGNVNNGGNLDQNVSTDLEVLFNEWNKVDSKYQNYEKNKSTIVDNFKFNITGLSDNDNTKLRLKLNTSNNPSIETDWIKVWSINKYTNLSWYYADKWPNMTEKVNSSIRVGFKIINNQTEVSYYYYPIEIFVNSSFTINQIRSMADSTYCKNENKSCYYYYLPLNRPDFSNPSGFFYWNITGLGQGTYNVSVRAGLHPEDRPTIISRIVTVQ